MKEDQAPLEWGAPMMAVMFDKGWVILGVGYGCCTGKMQNFFPYLRFYQVQDSRTCKFKTNVFFGSKMFYLLNFHTKFLKGQWRIVTPKSYNISTSTATFLPGARAQKLVMISFFHKSLSCYLQISISASLPKLDPLFKGTGFYFFKI